MRRRPAPARSIRRGLITLGAVCCGALVGCGGGGGQFTETGPTTTSSVLGVTITRADVEAAEPAVPVPLEATTTTTTAAGAPARSTTTRAAQTTTTQGGPPATTTTRVPRPNRFVGSYTARPGTDRVTIELLSNGGVFDTRELAGSGSFEFAGLPDGAYRIVITDTIDDDDPNDDNDTSSTVISATGSIGLTDGDTANASCTADNDCATSFQDAG